MAIGIQVSLTIKYSANGGYNPPSDSTAEGVGQDYPIQCTVRLAYTSGVGMYRDGYYCIGWSTNQNATTAQYAGGAEYTYTFALGQTTKTVTMYAVWKKSTYSINYNPGANGTGSPITDYKTHGVDIVLRGDTYTRTNYRQVGWATADGGAKMYDLGATYSTNASITLYPVWETTNLAYIKVSGTWKEAKIYIKVSGAWKEVNSAYVKVGVAWKNT